MVGGGDRETDKQVGKQTGDIYVGRRSGQAETGRRNKTDKEQKLKREGWRFKEKVSKAARGMAVRMGKGKQDGGKGAGDQWEAKENKFLLRRGRSRRRSGSKEQKIWKRRRKPYKQEEAGPSVGGGWISGENKQTKLSNEKCIEP